MSSFTVRLSVEETNHQVSLLDPGWGIVQDHHLMRNYGFTNFSSGLVFVNQVGLIAEKMNHHPDVYLSFKVVRLELYSHHLGGLCKGDFELARLVDLIG